MCEILRPDQEFIVSLKHKDLIEEYQKEKKQVDIDLSKQNQEQRTIRIARLRSATEDERAHRDLFNLCVFPFTERQKAYRETRYQYLRAAPLLELGLKNFDFLLYRTDPRRGYATIFGETKSSFSNPASIVQEVREKIIQVQSNLEYIKREYLQIREGTAIHLEYVIAVYSMDAQNILNAVSNSGGGIIVWQAPRAGVDELGLVMPPRALPNRQTMVPAFQELRRTLLRIPSSRACFGVLPQSHPLLQLQTLLSASDLEKKIARPRLISVLQTDLFWLPISDIETKADEILSLGERIGFLAHEDGSNDYHILSIGYKRAVIEKTLEEKWYNFRASALEEEEYEKIIDALQSNFEHKRDAKPTLDSDWP